MDEPDGLPPEHEPALIHGAVSSLSRGQLVVHPDRAAYLDMVGALYDCLAPGKSMTKPVGEWNRFTITCKDSLLTVIFNGEEVIRADLNDWKEPNKNPNGTPNKFKVALKDFARSGPIGLQGLHGNLFAAFAGH